MMGHKPVVYTCGVWDLLHVGHIQFLEAAAGLGGVLVVGVPTDAVVEEDKGKPPIIPFDQRVRMLRSVGCVTITLGYDRLEFLTHLQLVRPDILAVGQWGVGKRHVEAERFMEILKGKVVHLPYTDGVSTTLIIQKIKEMK